MQTSIPLSHIKTQSPTLSRVGFLKSRSQLFSAIVAVSLALSFAAQAQRANTAYGFDALSNDSGYENSAFGDSALHSNQSGADNTAIGFAALVTNTTGIDNTASGVFALNINSSGSYNTATGMSALIANQTGNDNTATGFQALYGGVAEISLGLSPGYNTATGAHALFIEQMDELRDPMDNYWIFAHGLDIAVPREPSVNRILRFSGMQSDVAEIR